MISTSPLRDRGAGHAESVGDRTLTGGADRVDRALRRDAAVLIARAADTDSPDTGSSFVGVATWALAVYFVLGVALNAASRSRAERMVMTPTTAVLATCALILAIG